MKKLQILAITAVVTLFFGCENGLFSPPEIKTGPGGALPGQGRLVLSVTGTEAADSPAKTLWPQQAPAFTKYGIEVYTTDEAGSSPALSRTEERTSVQLAEGKVELNLDNGYYNIKVRGYIGSNDLVALGDGLMQTGPGTTSKIIRIQSNQPTNVSVTLNPTMSVSDNSAKGTFSWSIKIPSDTSRVTRAVFRIYDWNTYNTSPNIPPLPSQDITDTSPHNTPLYNMVFRGDMNDQARYSGWLGSPIFPSGTINSPNNESTLNSVTTNSGSVSLAPGTYFVALILHNDKDVFFGRSEIVHVYSNMTTTTYENNEAKTPGWDFTGSEFYPRLITVTGNVNITVNGSEPTGQTVVYVYTGAADVGVNETTRQVSQFFYTKGEPYSVQVTVPQEGETLQFYVRGEFSQTAQYNIGSYTIPAYTSSESGTLTYNIPTKNIVYVRVNGTVKAHYLGKDDKEIWWLNIEAYEDAAYTKYVSAAGVPPNKTDTGLTNFEIILPSYGTYYFKIQAGSEVSGVLPLKNYEKRFSRNITGASIELGDIYFNGKGFTFNGTLSGDLPAVKGWSGIFDGSPYVAVYEEADMKGSALGKTSGALTDSWSLKAGVPYETPSVYAAFEFIRNGIVYRALAGSGALTADEIRQPAADQGLLNQANWDNHFREIATEDFPAKSGISLALPSLSGSETTITQVGKISKTGTGSIWLYKPQSAGNYIISAAGVNLASGFSPAVTVYGSGTGHMDGGSLLALSANTPYLILVSDPRGLSGDYLLNITKVEGSASILQVTSAWDVERVIQDAFEMYKDEAYGAWSVRVKFDMDENSVARYFDPAFDPESPVYKKTMEGADWSYILYPWYWSIDGYGWDATNEWSFYARQVEIGLSVNDKMDDGNGSPTGEPRWKPGQIVNIKLTLSKDGVPYSRDWLVHIPQ